MREFFHEIGRCSGGVLDEDLFAMFMPEWTMKDHILAHSSSVDGLIEGGNGQYIGLGEFFYMFTEGGEEYFLRTMSNDFDRVYLSDVNDNVIEQDFTFKQHIKFLVDARWNFFKQMNDPTSIEYRENAFVKELSIDDQWDYWIGKKIPVIRGDMLAE